ncbi:hypothetical protein E5288_WYG021772 [Bos mutus]|uniref:Uncharacterized protein n=1 Tax=Bos mutus TaxID=72004 RepID=A0A6B0SH58_9CETA|nr:hypothetical protein [Bos mutus]
MAGLFTVNSYWLPGLYFSTVPHSGVAESIFSSDSASFFDSASYFGTLFGCDSFSYVHSYSLPSLYFSRVSHSGVAELTFSFDSASFFDSVLYFGILFGFLRAQEQKKQFGFLVFFTFFD